MCPPDRTQHMKLSAREHNVTLSLSHTHLHKPVLVFVQLLHTVCRGAGVTQWRRVYALSHIVLRGAVVNPRVDNVDGAITAAKHHQATIAAWPATCLCNKASEDKGDRKESCEHIVPCRSQRHLRRRWCNARCSAHAPSPTLATCWSCLCDRLCVRLRMHGPKQPCVSVCARTSNHQVLGSRLPLHDQARARATTHELRQSIEGCHESM